MHRNLSPNLFDLLSIFRVVATTVHSLHRGITAAAFQQNAIKFPRFFSVSVSVHISWHCDSAEYLRATAAV